MWPFSLSYPLLWAFICSDAVGRPIIPSAVSALVQRADPQANVEYCGSVSTNRVDYYLFVLTRKELTGVVLVQYPLEKRPRRRRRYFPFPIQRFSATFLRAAAAGGDRRTAYQTQPGEESTGAARNLPSSAGDQRRWTRHRSCRLSDLRFSTRRRFHSRNLAAPPHRSHAFG